MHNFAQKPKSAKQNTPTKPMTSGRTHVGQCSEMNSILHWQRTIGDQAVERLLQSGAEELKAELTEVSSPRIGHDFSQIPIHPPAGGAIQTKFAIIKPGDSLEQEADLGANQKMASSEQRAVSGSPPRIQCKPTISAPSDRCEREANEVADKVMRMSDPAPINSIPDAIQRRCAKCDDKEVNPTQIKPMPSANTEVGLETDAATSAAIRGGIPLSKDLLAYFEPRFGEDFSSVRVHTDASAAQSARYVNANAYTVGHDLVFGFGQFKPGTHDGKRLIAHELVHVVQQKGSMVAAIQRDPHDHAPEVPVTSPSVPADRAAYQRYLETLRETMAKPKVTDTNLAKIIEKLYRDHPEIGSGSTAAAIRHELETGFATKGTRHLQAGHERMNMLADWLKNQKKLQNLETEMRAGRVPKRPLPGKLAPASDVATAEHLFLDLQQSVHSGYYADFEITFHPSAGGPAGGVDPVQMTDDITSQSPRRDAFGGERGGGESTLEKVASGESRAGRFARLGTVLEFAGPFVDAALMLLNYTQINIDRSAWQKLSKEKLLPIVYEQLKARSAEIAKIGQQPDSLYGVYANVGCELHFKVVPSATGRSLGSLKLYDVRFMGLSITTHDVENVAWNKERGRKEQEGIQDATFSILLGIPPNPEIERASDTFRTSTPWSSQPTNPPLYFSKDFQRRGPLLPQPMSIDALYHWARTNHPHLLDDPTLSMEIQNSNEFTGSQRAREKALIELHRKIQEEKVSF